MRLRRSLALPIDPAPYPAGVTLAPFTQSNAKQCRALLKAVYTDGLGDNDISFDGWWDWLNAHPDFDPDLMLVPMIGGEVVGFCHCWRPAFVKDLAVSPDHRHLGLGSAMLTTALKAFQQRGEIDVGLETDADNIKAQSLYRRLGFEVLEAIG